jgi:hypothetical protein
MFVTDLKRDDAEKEQQNTSIENEGGQPAFTNSELERFQKTDFADKYQNIGDTLDK